MDNATKKKEACIAEQPSMESLSWHWAGKEKD